MCWSSVAVRKNKVKIILTKSDRISVDQVTKSDIADVGQVIKSNGTYVGHTTKSVRIPMSCSSDQVSLNMVVNWSYCSG